MQSFNHSITQSLNAVLSALIAPPCAVCASVLDRPLDGAVCERCWASIAATGVPFSVGTTIHACAIGEYEGTLREVVHALKYAGRRSVARRLSQLMVERGSGVLAGADAVVPVPLHKRRQRERGFNQAADLAHGLGLPVIHPIRRIKHTPSQVDLPAAERHQNVRGAFSVVGPDLHPTTQTTRGGDPGVSPAGGILVLIDDVTTTGATLEACARVLRHAGAREVRALTAARVAIAPR
jgi:ComF family protein